MRHPSAVARHIAKRWESAHEKDIVHRDLKPGNSKVAGWLFAFWWQNGVRKCKTLGPCSQMSKSEVLREITSGHENSARPVYTF